MNLVAKMSSNMSCVEHCWTSEHLTVSWLSSSRSGKQCMKHTWTIHELYMKLHASFDLRSTLYNGSKIKVNVPKIWIGSATWIGSAWWFTWSYAVCQTGLARIALWSPQAVNRHVIQSDIDWPGGSWVEAERADWRNFAQHISARF